MFHVLYKMIHKYIHIHFITLIQKDLNLSKQVIKKEIFNVLNEVMNRK